MKKSSYSENDFHQFWLTSSYLTQRLQTQSGKHIEIIRRGSHNHDAGPDFLDVIIKIEGKLVTGDCELHLSAADWVQHNHQHDPRYNRVCLHVQLPSPEALIFRENGLPIEQLEIPLGVFHQFISAQISKNQNKMVYDCLLSRQSDAKKELTVHWAGVLRMAQKGAALADNHQQTSWDQMVYEGICSALGYNKNSLSFLKLARLVPIDLLFQEIRANREMSANEVASSLLFGAAGFLDDLGDAMIDGEIKAYCIKRLRYWQHCRHILQLTPMQRSEWTFFRLRPQNFPTRRIAAVAYLVEKFYHYGMLEQIISLLRSVKEVKRELVKTFREYFLIPSDPFWRHHFDFRSREMHAADKTLGHLVGKNRADDLIVNIILPAVYFYAEESRDSTLKNRVMEMYGLYPRLQPNSITQLMTVQLKTGDATFSRKSGARYQQGLIYLHKSLCRELRCDECLKLTTHTGVAEMGN